LNELDHSVHLAGHGVAAGHGVVAVVVAADAAKIDQKHWDQKKDIED
jgi:hypothetical protein